MKVFITGGTGFIGTYLAEKLVEEGYYVTILSRTPPVNNSLSNITYISGNPNSPGDWQKCLIEHDIVINLAGSSIFKRWNHKNKEIIRSSRVNTTKNVVEFLNHDTSKTTLLINASAIGFYGNHKDDTSLNETSPMGSGFLADVSKQWEKEASKLSNPNTHLVILRLGVVLGKSGGAFKLIRRIFKLGLGSRLGSGKQWFSWIHIEDLANIIIFIMKNKDISGIVNATAPVPVTNKDFTRALVKVLKRPSLLPSAPAIGLKVLMGEFSSILLEGQKVFPEVLTKMSFEFKYKTIEDALKSLK